MKTSTKIVGGIVLALVVIGAYIFPRSSVTTVVQGNSSVGASNSDAKIATITMAPLTAAATTTSILNTFGTDLVIESSMAYCTGVGTSKTFLTGAPLASLQLQMATTSVGFLGLQGNTNFAANLLIATSSVTAYTASSTEGTTIYGRLWPANTYLSITFNATNTAACTTGVNVKQL